MIKELKKGSDLISRIQKYSKSQFKLWRKVPYLALQADGRSGYLDQYAAAYYSGYWRIESSARNGSYTVIVDLFTGNLMDAYSAFGINLLDDINIESGIKPKLASPREIIALSYNLEEINATSIIEELEEYAKQPYFSGYDSKKQEQWRDDKIKELKLKKDFRR